VPVQQDLRLADMRVITTLSLSMKKLPMPFSPSGDHSAWASTQVATSTVASSIARRRAGKKKTVDPYRAGRSRQLIIMASMATSSSSSSISVMLQKSSSAIIRCSIERSLAAMSNLRIAKNEVRQS
jgi:hypothetical protein